MALTFNKIKAEEGSMVTMTKRLYLTADRKSLVKEGDQSAAFLFCVPGQRITPADASRYGLDGKAPKDEASNGKKEPNLGGQKDAGQDENKALAPAENKSAKKAKKKTRKKKAA